MLLNTSGPSLWPNHSQYFVLLSHYLHQLSEKKYLEPARTKFSQNFVRVRIFSRKHAQCYAFVLYVVKFTFMQVSATAVSESLKCSPLLWSSWNGKPVLHIVLSFIRIYAQIYIMFFVRCRMYSSSPRTAQEKAIHEELLNIQYMAMSCIIKKKKSCYPEPIILSPDSNVGRFSIIIK